jgi:hypothetical protein
MGKEVELNENPTMVTLPFIDRFHAPCHCDDNDDYYDGYSDMPPLERESNTDTEEYFNHHEPKFWEDRICVEHGHCFGFHIVPLEGAPSVFLHGVFLFSHSYPPYPP